MFLLLLVMACCTIDAAAYVFTDTLVSLKKLMLNTGQERAFPRPFLLLTGTIQVIL